MKRNLKSLFRRSRSKDSVKDSPSHAEPRPGPAQLLEQRRTQARKPGSDQHGNQHGLSPSSQTSSLYSGNNHTNSMQSERRSSRASKDFIVDQLDHTSSSADVPPDVDDSIAEDYRVYMLAASTPAADNANGPPGSDAGFMSLSGDSRLRTGASEMKHSEDVANRNIDQYGSTTSSHSRGSSLKGQLQQMNQAAQGRQARRMSVAASIVSLGSPHSIGESTTSSLHRYTLGTGVATGGGLIDGILPHVEDPQALSSARKKRPTRQARDESTLKSQRCKPADDDSPSEIIQEQPGRRTAKKNHGVIDFHEAIRKVPDDYKNRLRADLDGIVDLTDTEDVDKETQWAHEVTHETIKPHSHEIIQERIYREIHNHDVYHYIQPVYQTEILPARHFVHNANGDLVEIPADKLPECTGANQRWSLVRGDREKPNKHVVREPPAPRVPRILSDKTYITAGGWERRETTILHPPELEDMSGYDGPVVPIEFLHHPVEGAEHGAVKKTDKGLDHDAENGRFAMEELAEALPVARKSSEGSESSASRPPTGDSDLAGGSVKRMSIPRKPVNAFV